MLDTLRIIISLLLRNHIMEANMKPRHVQELVKRPAKKLKHLPAIHKVLLDLGITIASRADRHLLSIDGPGRESSVALNLVVGTEEDKLVTELPDVLGLVKLSGIPLGELCAAHADPFVNTL